jgi:SAM-dependent methyltransferase
MRRELRAITVAIEAKVPLHRGDLVLDIGSNDGTLLRSWSIPDLVRIGVEPADNLTTPDAYNGLELVRDFWPSKSGTILPNDKVKVITAIGMFYDLEDPNAFIAEVARVLHPDGVFVAQLMCLWNMMATNDIGNLCHEHLEFYSLKSLDILLANHGLVITDIETNAVNGQSYRLWISHKDKPADVEGLNRVRHKRLQEGGTTQPSLYQHWFKEATRCRNACVDFIIQQTASGKRTWVIGASTKGNTILQWYGLSDALIEAAVDVDVSKHGKYTIGTSIPIVNKAKFEQARPDLALILPWAFTRELAGYYIDWLKDGGKFIVPLPEPSIIEFGETGLVNKPLEVK